MPQDLRPRVLLADDHPGILRAFQRLLEPSCEVVGCVTDGVALLAAATSLNPDVIVLDVAMPSLDGLAACGRIKRTTPRSKVVVVTAANDAAIREEAFTAGASGFVLKHRVVEDLHSAIQRALEEDAPAPGEDMA